LDRRKLTATFVEKHCKSHVSEEWIKVDDSKIAKLRGIIAALQEENQSTQLLKRESENADVGRQLETTRAGVETRLMRCKAQEDVFERSQAALRRHVLDNEKSLQELETNIEKGEKKLRDEQTECRKLDNEVNLLEADMAGLESGKATEQKKISRTSQYKKFLEAVVHECEEDFEGDIENLMNRHNTLEAGNQELHQMNTDLTTRLDSKREEATRVRSRLQSEHLVIGSKLHESQVTLDKHRAESREFEQRLTRALEEREIKEGQVGVIQMAIEQLFTRTVMSCRLKQRKKVMVDAVEKKLVPVRGVKADFRLKGMLEQIIERMSELRDMHREGTQILREEKAEKEKDVVVDGDDMMDKVQFVHQEAQRRPNKGGFLKDGEKGKDGNSSDLASGTSGTSRGVGKGKHSAEGLNAGMSGTKYSSDKSRDKQDD